MSADYYIQTHSTDPLLRVETITKAIEIFLDSRSKYDSLFSVTILITRLWDTKGNPINHNPTVLLRTQDQPPIFEENSNIYIFTQEIIQKFSNRIGKRPLMFEIDRMEAWDIDKELDFRLAEFFYRTV